MLAILLGHCVERILDERRLNLIGGVLFVGFGLFELIWKVILDKA
jgi:putative Ca2+/H+ antiporter (TMEM165/GDT1 family)